MKHYNKKISVIIPTYNSVETVEKAIDSLLLQTYQLTEIIVIDNASTDQTVLLLQKKFGKRIKLITLKKNSGVTGGRNTGLRQISPNTDVVLFMDHDMMADANMVEELVKCFEYPLKPGIITPKIFYKKPKNIIWSAGTGMNLWTGQVTFRGGKDKGQFDQSCEVQVAPAVLLVKKEVLKKVKQFDPIYFATYEDTDFCFKAFKYGFKTFYMPSAIAYHDLPYNSRDAQMRLLNRLYYIGRNRIIFLRRYGKSTSIPFSLLFAFYYFVLCLRYKRAAEFINYLKGTIDGMIIKV